MTRFIDCRLVWVVCPFGFASYRSVVVGVVKHRSVVVDVVATNQRLLVVMVVTGYQREEEIVGVGGCESV